MFDVYSCLKPSRNTFHSALLLVSSNSAAIFRAASLATPLRDMLHESLQRVTPLATVKIDAKLAATNVAESRIGFYFSQRLQQLFLALQRVTPPLQQVSQCCGFKTPVRMRNSLPGKQQRWRMR